MTVVVALSHLTFQLRKSSRATKSARMFGRNDVKLLLTWSLLATEASRVMERHDGLSCSDLCLSFDRQCEHVWSVHQSTFAYAFFGSESQCHPPCGSIKDGVMKLKECVAVNQTSTCHVEEDRRLVREERTYYSPLPRSAAPPSAQAQGFLHLLLLVVLSRL